MATESESILLNISPKVRTKGLQELDTLIAQLEKLDRYQGKDIHVNVITSLKGMRSAEEKAVAAMQKATAKVPSIPSASTKGPTANAAALAQAEKQLAAQAMGSVAALNSQNAILQEKMSSLNKATSAARQFAQSEKLLAEQSKQTAAATSTAGRAAAASGSSFLKNTTTLVAWSASAGVLYGALNLVSTGFDSRNEIERKTATLGQVFRGTKQDSLALRDGVLELGAAYNRSSDESLDAAIRFSRLGLTKAEVLESVAVAMQAANVAEISVGQAAEQTSSIMAAYNMNVGQLRGTIGSLNTISNTYNTTTKDLLNGIARVAPLAKQAGLSLSELMGLIGSGVGRTGRPGAEFGNAIKSIITGLTNPADQKKLQDLFNFDVRDQTGQMKDFSAVLQDLFVKYQELNGAERQSLANTIGKKMQASRLTALLDGYVQAQVLAIRANRNLASAEKENEAIRATLSSQLQGLTTQFEAFISTLMKSNASGGAASFLRELVELMKNLLAVLTAGGDITAYFASGLAALTLSTILYVVATNKAGVASGFLLNTLTQARVAAMGLAEGFLAMTAGTGRATIGMLGLARAVEGFGVAAALVETITGMIVVVAAIALVTWGAEKAMGAFNDAMAESADVSEKANAKLAGFNQELERLRGLAKAEGDVAKLSDTISRAIQSPNANVKDVEEWLKLMEEVGGLAKGELQSLYQRGDRVQLINRLQEIGLDAQRKKAGYSQEEAKSTRIMLADLKEQSKLSEKQLINRGQDPFSDEGFKNLQNRIQELRGGASALPIMGEDEQEQVAEVNTELEKQNSVLQHKLDLIDRIYGALSKGNEVDKINDEIAAEKAKLALLDLQTARYRQRLGLNSNAQFDNNAAFPRKDEYVALQQKMMELRAKADLELSRDAEKRRKDAEKSALGKAFEKEGKAYATTGDAFSAAFAPSLQTKAEADHSQEALDAMTEMTKLRQENVDLLAEGAVWDERNKQLNEQQVSLLQGKESIQQQANQKAREEIEIQLEKLETEKRFLALKLDAIEAGKREALIASSGSRVGDNQSSQDLAELRNLMAGGSARNGMTGIAGIAEAKKELAQIQSRIEEKLVRAQNVDPRDEVRSLQLLEQLRASGVRMEELRLNAVTRLHAIEADITNEKMKQQQEASKSLLLASREEQLRAALAAKFAQSRGGKGFSAQEFQYLSQETRQAINQNNPDLAPRELQGRLKELESERQQLIDFFSKANGAVESFADQVLRVAEELKSRQILPTVAGGEGAPDLDSQIVKAGGAVVSAVDAMGKTVIDTFDKMTLSVSKITTDLAGRVSVLEIGLSRGVDPAAGAQSGVRNLF